MIINQVKHEYEGLKPSKRMQVGRKGKKNK